MYAEGVRGIEGLSLVEIQEEIAQGGKFVQYRYVVSYVVLAHQRLSDVYFIFGDESKVTKGLQ